MLYQEKRYRLIIFTADGTLSCTKSGEPGRQSADDWQLLPGRKERLHEIIQASGTQLFIVTNADEVALGAIRGADMIIELSKLTLLLDIPPKNLLYCFSHPQAANPLSRIENDDRRIPGPAMLKEAMALMNCQPGETLVIGFNDRDRGAAEAAGCDFAPANEFFQEEPASP